MKKTVIKSFEEGAEQSGDILTGGKIKRNIRIGLLTCGYFEYWRMYPNLREKVEGDLKAVTDRITASYPDVVLSGMVDTLDSAEAAGKLFKQKAVDVVLLVYGTYTADFITLAALDQVKDRPLLIYSTQPHDDVDRNGDYEGSLRNSALIGIAQITGTLRKMKRDYKIIVGSVTDERAYALIDRYLSAAQAVERLGRTEEIWLVGFDSNVASVDAMQTGAVDALVVQNPYAMGYLGVESAYRLLAGQKADVPVLQDTETSTVTRETMFTLDSQKVLFAFE